MSGTDIAYGATRAMLTGSAAARYAATVCCAMSSTGIRTCCAMSSTELCYAAPLPLCDARWAMLLPGMTLSTETRSLVISRYKLTPGTTRTLATPCGGTDIRILCQYSQDAAAVCSGSAAGEHFENCYSICNRQSPSAAHRGSDRRREVREINPKAPAVRTGCTGKVFDSAVCPYWLYSKCL
eukprot:3206749-Rhodomonas_salina.2